MNPIIPFWRPDQIEAPESSGIGVKFSLIKDKISEVISFLEEFKQQITTLLEDEYLKE